MLASFSMMDFHRDAVSYQCTVFPFENTDEFPGLMIMD